MVPTHSWLYDMGPLLFHLGLCHSHNMITLCAVKRFLWCSVALELEMEFGRFHFLVLIWKKLVFDKWKMPLEKKYIFLKLFDKWKLPLEKNYSFCVLQILFSIVGKPNIRHDMWTQVKVCVWCGGWGWSHCKLHENPYVGHKFFGHG